MKTGELITSLAEQSKVTLDDEQAKVINGMTTEIPGDIAKTIQSALFTKESALANTEIINHLKAESLDPVDQKIKEFAKESGLGEGFLTQLNDTKGTYKRFDSVIKAVSAANKLAVEKAGEGAGDDSELKKQIQELNAQILTHKEGTISKTDYDSKVDEYEGMLKKNAENLKQMKIQNVFSGQNWAMDVPSEVNVATAMGLLNGELNSKGLSVVDDNGSLKLQTQEKSAYFIDNKEISLKDFASSVLASNKLLKVTNTSTTTTPTVVVPGAPGLDPSVVAAMAKAAESNKAIVESVGTQQ